MIYPRLKKGKNLKDYVQGLARFVFREVNKLTGADLHYRIEAGKQTAAIASISYGSWKGMTDMGLRQDLRVQHQLRQELKQEMMILHLNRIDDFIDIEHCDDLEAAFFGAFAAMLHEIGHHFDINISVKDTDFLKESNSADCDIAQIREVICDRIALLLGYGIDSGKTNPEMSKRLYWISKLGIFHGFIIRYMRGLYDFEPEGLLKVLLRFKMDYEQAVNMKDLDGELREHIKDALSAVNSIIGKNEQRNGAPGLDDGKSVSMLKKMRFISRNLTLANLVDAGEETGGTVKYEPEV